MTQPLDPGTQPPQPPQPPRGSRPGWWRRLRRYGIPLGGVLLVGVGIGAWWTHRFIHTQLAPLVSTTLTETLKRPVQIGKLERFSLTSIRFGPSAIPATATDPDWVKLQAVEVGFDPIQILRSRDLNLDVTLIQPQVYLEQDAKGLWVATEIAQKKDEGPVKVDLKTLRLQDADITLAPWAKTGKGVAPGIQITPANGRVDFLDRNQRFAYQLDGRSPTGGTVKLSGETLAKPLRSTLKIAAQNFAVTDIDRLIKLPIDLPKGQADGNVIVEIPPNQGTPTVTGSATVRNVTLQIPRAPQALSQIAGNLRFQGTTVQLDKIRATYGQIPLRATGSLDTKRGFNLAAKVPSVKLAAVTKTLGLSVPFVAEGTVVADLKVTGPLAQPILSGKARSASEGKLDRVSLRQFSTEFSFDPQKMVVQIPAIAANPTAGGQITGSGRVQLTPTPQVAFRFQGTDLPGDAIAPAYNNGNPLPITLGRIAAQVQLTGPAADLQTRVQWQAPEATYAGTGEILVAGGQTTLRNTRLTVGGGTLVANAQTQGDQWTAIAKADGVILNRFSPDLRGQLNGQLNVTGSLASFRPADIRARGAVTFSEGISLVRQPLTAQIQWDGQKIAVQNATAPGFRATGAVFAQLEGTPAITGFDLAVQATDLTLAELALPTPSTVQLAGRTDFSGQLTGSPTDPKVAGDLTLRQLTVNGVAFEPTLRGSVTVAQGVVLKLAGDRDRIALNFNAQNQLTGFDLRKDLAIAGLTGLGQANNTRNSCAFAPLTGDGAIGTATGTAQGDVLNVQATNLPLGLLVPGGGLMGLSGQVNGTVAVNLNQMSLAGQVDVACPAIANFRADQFGGRIAFANGTATLNETRLRRGKTTLTVSGSANVLSPDPQIKGQVDITEGTLEDMLALAQLFDLNDFLRGATLPTYGTAADLQTTPVAMAQTPIWQRFQRLAEIQKWVAQKEEERKNALLPELRDIKGNFSAKVDVAGSLKSGFDLGFKLKGSDWEWGRYTANTVIVEGTSKQGVVELVPFRLESKDGIVSFSGKLGDPKEGGQFRLENVSMETLSGFFNLPIDIEGKVQAIATVVGTLDNPTAAGDIRLTEGLLGGKPVEKAEGFFGLGNARLNLGVKVLLAQEAQATTASPTASGQPGTPEIAGEPLEIAGELPSPLSPWTKPSVDLTIKVKNEGMALLNILTNGLVEWQSGQGQVDLKVGGTLLAPKATGTIDIADATLTAQAMPGPLTNVTGKLLFDGDRLQIVDQLTAQFSQGDVVAKGGLRLFPSGDLFSTDPAADPANTLDVSLEKIALRLKGIYQGGVAGRVTVTGAAIAPVIGGEIRLQDGQVLLSDSADAAAIAGTPGAPQQNTSAVTFNQLDLRLGDRVRVTRLPILNFLASGNLVINGSLNDLQPKGTINLKAGQVNLFTTQFNLMRGYPQTAEFVANQGLDPNLDIRLIASLPEATGGRLPASAVSSEISDSITPATRFGGLQTVRVEAKVQGLASQLFDRLELTSSPARSTAEIIALLGGGFVNTLGRGDTTLGIANLAGSALLTNIQTVIGNALGLSEFRLFSTLTQDRRNRESRSSSNLGLAAEAAVDITPAISLSVLKILTADDPAQFGVRYRLNDNFLVRSSTDFAGDTRAVVEYEARF
jgi:translocation and assembly module TamB